MNPVRAYIGLGSNLGDREANLRLAVDLIDALSAVRVEAISRLYESDAVGPGDQGPYLNGVVELTCVASAEVLLASLLEIELRAGRNRADEVERWTARTLDLDLLFYGDACVEQPGLSLPHPRLHERAFVLEPLCDLAPEMIHPRQGIVLAELARAAREHSPVQLWPGTLAVPS